MMRAVLLGFLLAALLVAQQGERENARGDLAGQVVSTQGRPLPGAVVTVSKFGDRGQSQLTGPDGRYRFSGLQPGPREVRATKSNYGSDGELAEIVAGDVVDVRPLRLQPRSVIAGTVTTADGLPMVGASVQLWLTRWDRGEPFLARARSSSTDDLGRYRIFELTQGDYVVSLIPARNPAENGRIELLTMPRLYPEGRGAELESIRLGSGETMEGVDFRGVEPVNTVLRGEVRLEPEPAACFACEVQISRYTTAGLLPLFTFETAPGGLFSLSGLEPGSYSLAVVGRSAPNDVFAGVDFASVDQRGPTSVVLRAAPPPTATARIHLIDPPSNFFDDTGNWRSQVDVSMQHHSPPLFEDWRVFASFKESKGDRASSRFFQPLAPGEYELPRISARSENLYIRSLTMEGHPIRDGRVRVPAHLREIHFDLEVAFDVGA